MALLLESLRVSHPESPPKKACNQMFYANLSQMTIYKMNSWFAESARARHRLLKVIGRGAITGQDCIHIGRTQFFREFWGFRAG